MTELNDGEVRGERGLFAFFPDDANTWVPLSEKAGNRKRGFKHTNVGSLDHADIISSISNTTYSFPGMFPYKACNISFLGRRTPASHYCREFSSNLYEFVRE